MQKLILELLWSGCPVVCTSHKADALGDACLWLNAVGRKPHSPSLTPRVLQISEKSPLFLCGGEYPQHKHYLEANNVSREDCRCVFGNTLGSGAVQWFFFDSLMTKQIDFVFFPLPDSDSTCPVCRWNKLSVPSTSREANHCTGPPGNTRYV